MIIFSSLLQNSIRTLYAMNFNNIILVLFIELATFYLIRNHIINKAKKKWTILVWHPTLAGIMKKSLLTFHLLYAVYGILVFCPISDTQANPIPLYALYQLLMHGKIEPLTLSLYNTVLMFPVGLWIGEVFKPARSSFLYKWTAILTGIIGIYMEYSQYVLDKGRPAADDLIFIMLACCAGIFFRDAYEKVKQYYKLIVQLVRNEKNKRQRAKEKAEKKAALDAEKAERDAELDKIEEMAREEEEEKKRLEAKAKRRKRKEAAEPYIEKMTGTSFYRKLSDLAAVFVYFLLAAVQWLAELVADKNPEEDYHLDEDDFEEEIEGEPRWKKLKRENQRMAKNPMMKKSRRMKREAMRRLRAQEDVDKELEATESEAKAEEKALKELENELKFTRLFRKLNKDIMDPIEEDFEEDIDEMEEIEEIEEDLEEEDLDAILNDLPDISKLPNLNDASDELPDDF